MTTKKDLKIAGVVTLYNPTDEDIYYIGTFCCVISVTKLKYYHRIR